MGANAEALVTEFLIVAPASKRKVSMDFTLLCYVMLCYVMLHTGDKEKGIHGFHVVMLCYVMLCYIPASKRKVSMDFTCCMCLEVIPAAPCGVECDSVSACVTGVVWGSDSACHGALYLC